MKKNVYLCCILLLTLLTQAGNVKAAVQGTPNLTKQQKATKKGDAKAQGALVPEASKQIKGIADGFRGVPWGILESEAESYGLTGNHGHYRKKNENNSLGNVPLSGIDYIFTNSTVPKVNQTMSAG